MLPLASYVNGRRHTRVARTSPATRAPADPRDGALPLERERWRAYFEAIAAGPAWLAQVDVVEPLENRGSRARALPLGLIAYDPARAVLELELALAGGHVRHFISAPREIRVCESADGRSREILIHDASGIWTRVRLRDICAARAAREERPLLAQPAAVKERPPVQPAVRERPAAGWPPGHGD